MYGKNIEKLKENTVKKWMLNKNGYIVKRLLN